MDARAYARLLLEQRIVILAIALLVEVIAAAYCLTAPVRYQSSAKVFVSLQQAGSVQELSQGGAFTQQQVKSYADLAATPAVLDPVIKRLSLTESSEDLATHVSAVAPLDTVIISLTASWSSARGAKELVDATASSLSSVVEGLTPSSQRGESAVNLAVIQAGDLPLRPTSPNVSVLLVGGLAAGLCLGSLFVIVRRRVDRRVHSDADIAQITVAPVLARVQYDSSYRSRPILRGVGEESARAEVYKLLRSNMQFLDIDNLRRYWVITSALPGEGKTTTAVNLGVALAEDGVKVVLVDGDLRRPQVATYAGIDGTIGFSEVLTGRVELHEAMQQWAQTSLYILPSGTVPPNPSELLNSTAAETLFSRLQQDFDVVLVDAPPVLPVVDALVLAHRAGGVLMVCATSKIKSDELASAVAAVHQAGAAVDGLILTMLRPTQFALQPYAGSYNYDDPKSIASRSA